MAFVVSDVTRPLIVYDDDCGFCTWSVRYADARGDFDIVGFSELSPELRGRLPADYESCVHLIADGRVYSCGAAAEEVLSRLGWGWGLVIGAVRLVPFRAKIREPLYRWVADHRSLFGRLVRRFG